MHSRLNRIYSHIKERCYKPYCKSYKYYGGRGIKMCEEWLNSYESFKEWALNNGYREDLTLDRIDVNGDYSPNNCRWVSMKVQQNNRTNNHFITYNGKTKTLTQWCEELNLPYYKIRMRIDYGNWTPEKAFETTENARLQMITYNNKTQHLQAWCDELGLNYKTVWIRIKRGWSVKDAFEKKVRCKGGVAE